MVRKADVDSYFEDAQSFCTENPYRRLPYSKRNWGGTLHSLCSYQGKLKPSIAHFLVDRFTQPGQVVLDPMAGIGTIPLEARRLGRVGLANDLSPLAYIVSSAKLEKVNRDEVAECLIKLRRVVQSASSLVDTDFNGEVNWGLNKTIADYFHPMTLREIVLARRYFSSQSDLRTPSENLVLTSLLHILHGNRPYALSRTSHPITPFAPSGDFEYRPLIERLEKRVSKAYEAISELGRDSFYGVATLGDFRQLEYENVDAIITSPPFTDSLRFWSSNWMRLWFAGWDEPAFRSEPSKFLESQQKTSFEPYRDLFELCARSLKPGGKLILHLGETSRGSMADHIIPLLTPHFEVVHLGREGVEDTETHGLTAKGATTAHIYLFARKRIG